ncbi:hypothetical protein DZF91_25590 [Actinomadura logoneensis]|uniref:Uncharacterized protein n=1 Tax=Actinomadura logoneensis TaxID=2293572 RepID=A0A372JG03_9ACTN|nr:hypothetical protein DZF91_25590 [Actinomadura logoneensis]
MAVAAAASGAAARTLGVLVPALLAAAALSSLLPRRLPWPDDTGDGHAASGGDVPEDGPGQSRIGTIRASLLRHVHPGRSR